MADEPKTICADCKWPYKIRARDPLCMAPHVAERSRIRGFPQYPSCGTVNAAGKCPHYEPKRPWWARLFKGR